MRVRTAAFGGWIWYIGDTEPHFDEHKCGKWMYFFEDRSFVESVLRERWDSRLFWRASAMREMKDSGIEWVGQIPESWNVLRNKYNFVLGKDLIGANWEKAQLLSLTKYGVKAITPEEQTGKVPTSFTTYQIVKKNDLVMCLFDLDVSAVFSGISQYDGMISPAYKCFKCKSNLNPRCHSI